ncbi:hypothetical protein BN14_11974 [Rhizoctonia solani AG-1 IB]|uniref:Uncharacterized protein n=1 Tax=Thanatephorus cucumeris (strain AG1-IB / isolate 7/3/14) TaxID=1108050 RepID=M5CEU5_THACB|nr:hypothetical protein BN14_11974 [Rhizoctonia solani AG-1 IB]
MSQAASTVMQSQELCLSQLSPGALKRRLDLESDDEQSQQSSAPPPRSRWRLQSPTGELAFSVGGASAAPSMVSLDHKAVPAPAGTEEEEDLGVIPQPGRQFRRKGKCYLLTYAQYVKSEATRTTSHYEVIKDLVDHLYTLKSGENSLLEYAVGVTESHDLKEGQWQPDWHCHIIVWARDLIHSEALDLWKYKGICPHEQLLALRTDKGGFPPLSALQYFKKEADAWEACYGNLTEEFLRGQSPAEVKAKQSRNEDFSHAIEAPTVEEFYKHLREAC